MNDGLQKSKHNNKLKFNTIPIRSNRSETPSAKRIRVKSKRNEGKNNEQGILCVPSTCVRVYKYGMNAKFKLKPINSITYCGGVQCSSATCYAFDECI